MKHRLGYLMRRFIGRRHPSGLLSPAYLWPGFWPTPLAQQIRAHRRLWWQVGSPPQSPLPRLPWCLAELWLWLRWSLFEAWRASYRTVKRQTKRAHDPFRRAFFIQWLHCLHLALFWGITPRDFYRFGLNLDKTKSASAKALAHVHAHETRAWHHHQNQQRPDHLAQQALLADKLAFAQCCQDLGIPTVANLAVDASRKDLDALLGERSGPLFCKSRHGHGGKGAFRVDHQAKEPRVQPLGGKSQSGEAVLNKAWGQVHALGPVLIQPHLAQHPSLDAFNKSDEIINLRLITQDHVPAPRCWAAFLEVPHQRAHLLVPIELDTGTLLAPCNLSLRQQEQQQSWQNLWQQTGASWQIPHWRNIKAHSLRGQGQLTGLHAIAWDWAITPQGPKLLEANSQFDLGPLQSLAGGLISDS